MSQLASAPRIPALRFPEFSGEWEEKKLGDIGRVAMCKRILKDQTLPFGDIPFYKIGTFGKEADAFISTDLYKEYKSKYPHPKAGDVLISASGTIGRTVVYDGLPAYFQDSNIVWIDNDEQLVKNSFLYFFYETVVWNTEDTTIARLYNDNLKSIRIETPSLPEQTKIAAFLSTVDSKIDQLSQKKALLEQYKKGVMQQIFSQQIRFKADDGSDYPEWEEKKLGEITKKVSIKNKENKKLPVYSISNKRGFIPQDEQFEGVDSSDRNYDISLYKIIHKNTFAYNPARINVGSIGYSGDLDNIIVSSLYVCFVTNNVLNDLYLLQYLNTFDFNKQVLRNTEGGVRDYLFYENFSNIKMNLPCLEEQTKIANFLFVIDSKIEQVTQQLETAKQFKKGLLQQMFV
ncbi:MAG: restriction endonuclease subunit S [Gammaproteobacteria bacterium]|nr:restriction endonuclease subunit S [Gammaproteobacteria bacterium]